MAVKNKSKLKISTEVLKELLSRSIKGMGANRHVPLTELMCIKLENGTLTLITTDANSYLYVKKKEVEGTDFYVVVRGEQFSKLVSKFTCDMTEIWVSNNALEVHGNGDYQIEIPLDEGKPIEYPDPMTDLVLDEDMRHELRASTVQMILDSCKTSLALTLEDPWYTGYYVGDNIIATNKLVVSSIDINILGDDPVLIPSTYMDLLSVMTEEKFSAFVIPDENSDRDHIVCTSSDCVVYGDLMERENLDEFEVDAFNEYINQEMDSSCKVNKMELLSVLDRVSLFVGAYDDGAVDLTFTQDGLSVSSKQSNGVDVVSYTSSRDYKPFTGSVEVKQLINIIKSNPEDEVTIEYGSDEGLKMTAGTLVFIIALITDEEDEDGENES